MVYPSLGTDPWKDDLEAAIADAIADAVAGVGGDDGDEGRWALAVDLPLDDLTGWTNSSGSGSWNDTGDVFQQTSTSGKHVLLLDQFQDVSACIFEVEILYHARAGDCAVGLMIGAPATGSSGACDAIYICNLNSGSDPLHRVRADRDTITNWTEVALGADIPFDTWFKMRVHKMGRVLSFYVDDVLTFCCEATAGSVPATAMRIGMQTVNADCSFRNLKFWAPTLPVVPEPSGLFSDFVLGLAPSAWWRLGEASGTTMGDSSGNARDGVYNYGGSTAPTLGAVGLLHDTDTDTAATYAGSGLSGITWNGGWMEYDTFSVFGRVKPSTVSGAHMLFGNYDHAGANTRSWHLVFNDDVLNFTRFWGGGSYTVDEVQAGIDADTEYSVGVTVDGGLLKVFVDGVELYSDSDGFVAGTSAFLIGGAWDGTASEQFVGDIDEVVYWGGVAISDADMLTLHETAVP